MSDDLEKKPRRQRVKRSYSDAEKIDALEAVNLCGGNVSEAGRLTDVPERTLRQWTQGMGVTEEIYAAYANKKAGMLTSRLRALQCRLVEALFDEKKIDKAFYKELVTGFGVVTDKLRLIDGKPTEITEVRDPEMQEDALQLLAEYKQMLNGDEATALEFLKKDAPTLASTLIH